MHGAISRTRREALARIDAELARAATRLEQGGARVSTLGVEHDELSATHTRHLAQSLPRSAPGRGPRRASVARAADARRAADDALRLADADAARWHPRGDGLPPRSTPVVTRPHIAALDDVARRSSARWSTTPTSTPGSGPRCHAVLGDTVRAVVVDGPVRGAPGARAARRRRRRRVADRGRRRRCTPAGAQRAGRPPPSPIACAARCRVSQPRSSGCSTGAVPGRRRLVARPVSPRPVAQRSSPIDGDRFGGRGSWRLGGDAPRRHTRRARRRPSPGRGVRRSARRRAREPRRCERRPRRPSRRRSCGRRSRAARGPRARRDRTVPVPASTPSARSGRSSSPRSPPSRTRWSRSEPPTSRASPRSKCGSGARGRGRRSAVALESRALVQLELDERAHHRGRVSDATSSSAPRSSPNGARCSSSG